MRLKGIQRSSDSTAQEETRDNLVAQTRRRRAVTGRLEADYWIGMDKNRPFRANLPQNYSILAFGHL